MWCYSTPIVLWSDGGMTNNTCGLSARHADEEQGEDFRKWRDAANDLQHTYTWCHACWYVLNVCCCMLLLMDVRQCEAKNQLLEIRLTEHPWDDCNSLVICISKCGMSSETRALSGDRQRRRSGCIFVIAVSVGVDGGTCTLHFCCNETISINTITLHTSHVDCMLGSFPFLSTVNCEWIYSTAHLCGP